MAEITSDKVISTILKHDSKTTSYKMALLRAVNDIVLTFPDLRTYHSDVAVPLRLLAEFWIAYYWPFVDPRQPIDQGQRANRNGQLTQDIAFRSALTQLRQTWEESIGGLTNSADGFFLINEMRSTRKRSNYPSELFIAYQQAISAISNAIRQPIRYAGPGNWSVFDKPVSYTQLPDTVVPIPGTQFCDSCVVIPFDLWQTFRRMSLWVEALCIHEWCLFTEAIANVNRGYIYSLLTDRPDNRRPLTWERNQIDLLLMEGTQFTCPWTRKVITNPTVYALDHLLPIAIYPTNELWNLVPADPAFNSHTKRDRLPTAERLYAAKPYFEQAYNRYELSSVLSAILREDAQLRFARVQLCTFNFTRAVANAVADLIEEVAESRNLARF